MQQKQDPGAASARDPNKKQDCEQFPAPNGLGIALPLAVVGRAIDGSDAECHLVSRSGYDSHPIDHRRQACSTRTLTLARERRATNYDMQHARRLPSALIENSRLHVRASDKEASSRKTANKSAMRNHIFRTHTATSRQAKWAVDCMCKPSISSVDHNLRWSSWKRAGLRVKGWSACTAQDHVLAKAGMVEKRRSDLPLGRCRGQPSVR